MWEIRYDACNGRQVKVMHSQRQILQSIKVFIVAEQLNTRTVTRLQFHACGHPAVVTDKDITAFRRLEITVTQYHVVFSEPDADAVRFKRGLETSLYAYLVLVITENQVDIAASLYYTSVEQSIETILGIVLLVLHLTMVSEAQTVGNEFQPGLVQLHTAGYKGVNLHISVET